MIKNSNIIRKENVMYAIWLGKTECGLFRIYSERKLVVRMYGKVSTPLYEDIILNQLFDSQAEAIDEYLRCERNYIDAKLRSISQISYNYGINQNCCMVNDDKSITPCSGWNSIVDGKTQLHKFELRGIKTGKFSRHTHGIKGPRKRNIYFNYCPFCGQPV